MCVLELNPKGKKSMNTYNLRKALCAVSGIVLITASLFSFSGCQNSNDTPNATPDQASATSGTASTDDEVNALSYLDSIGINAAELGIEPDIIRDDNRIGFQLDNPKDGETIAVMHTSLGDITIRFFPNQAPKTVTNFINLAKDGKYNNTLFSKVTKDFMINGGYCGTSSYGSAFEDEFCDKLFNIRGAVAMSNTGYDSNESAFFINQKSSDAYKAEGGWQHLADQWKTIKTQFLNYKNTNLLSAFIEKNGTNCYNTDIVPTEVKQLYDKNGGNAYLDGAYNAVDRGYTVFAQVIDGMDVVDKIADADVDDDDIPKENIVIESVEITSYSGAVNTPTAETALTAGE